MQDASSFEIRLANFVDSCQAFVNEEFARLYSNLVPPRFDVMRGKRYIRIVRQDRGHIYKDGVKTDEIVDTHGRSVHCFVDMVNGDLLKAASWKGPETKHARGNIFASEQPVDSFYMTSKGVTPVLREER